MTRMIFSWKAIGFSQFEYSWYSAAPCGYLPLLPPPHPRTPTHTHSNIFVPSAADIQWSPVLSVCMCVWEREALDRRLISDSNERFISPSRGHHITHTACSMDVMMISHLGSRREKPSLTFKGIVLIYISVCRRYAWQQIVRVLF